MVTWPSGKARVCKTLIHQFKSGRHLQKIPGCRGIRDFLLFFSLNNLLIGKSLSLLFALCYGKRVSKETAKSLVVLCIVLFSTPIETYMSYALNRIFDTAIGVIAALLVNYFLPRPRVVSLWEGFKGSFKKDSKV